MTSSSLQVSLASTLSTSHPFAPLDPLMVPPPSSAPSMGGLDESLYGLTHDLHEPDPEQQTSQKITLLSRPRTSNASQSPLSSSPLNNCMDDNMMGHTGSSGVHLLGDEGSGQLLPLTRGDGYFDSEDPSVNLHEFIVNSMQAQKNRVVLLQLEEEFLKFITDQSRTESLKLPSWDSYHRMLAHRVAAYFGLDHNVDPLDKTCVVVQKGPSTRIPVQRFNEHIPSLEEPEVAGTEPKLILKRIRESNGSDKFDGLDGLSANATNTEIKSFEEREVEYEKARARIFSQSINKLQDLSESTDKSFDLFNSNSSLRSALRAPMAHRRTFSDTTFFNHLKKSKQGPSSSGNSPSNTPSLFFPSLSPPPSLTPPPLTKPVSPTIGVGGIESSPIHKTTAQEDSSIVQAIQQQQAKKSPPSRSQTASFVPLYSQTPPSIPVMYHPQPTLVNPSIYYNPLVVYPIAPHPTAAIHTYPSMVNAPVLQQHYVTHPLSVGSPKMGGVRMPGTSVVPEPLSPTGIVYRPIQQATPIQVKPEDYGVAPPIAHPGPLWSSQIDPAQFAVGYPNQGLPSPQGYPAPMMGGASQLVEQMEKSLTISDDFDHTHIHENIYMTGLDKSRVSPAIPRVMGNGRGLPGPAYGYSMQPNMEQPIMSPTAPPPGGFIPDGEQHLGYQLRDNRQDGGHQLLSHMHPGLGHTPQGLYPPSGSVTPQPVQILGHSLSTTIFSPPPSAGPPGMFYSTGAGKPGSGVHSGSPIHAPVGSGVRFKRYSSPKQTPGQEVPVTPQSPQATPHSIVEQSQLPTTSPVMSEQEGLVGSPQQLPPRLNQRGSTGGSNSGTRYQNQRHPSNRSTLKGEGFVGGGGQGGYPSQVRREPLLPTPNEMIKLDTGITAGVPVNVMEVLYPPHEDSPEYQVLMQNLKECGVQDFKRGVMGRNMEIMVAIFDSPDAALLGLKQCVLPVPAKLTIPLPNHAKYILQLLSAA